ncbi:uncharacterized protein LOC115776266 [Archocentrus centrarchus]|uniref:uncharacterized protein LOC115776266 n=1 Tax=Archocentrus centrarchus TaxID=63155 RepID=UPI0011E9F534|nr:uncharacterized protein LOC115776266 [Archocentrus centrarchus]
MKSSFLLILSLITEKNVCPKPFYQNVNKTENTTIRCDSPHKHQSYFFCKQSNSSCIDVLSGKSSSKYTDTNRDKGFNVSISTVSLQDAGLYWCGIKSNDNNYNFLLKQIQLKVIVNFRRSLMIGQNFSYWCKYDDDSLLTKFICKGDDPSTCQPLVNTTNTEMNVKFSMTDNKQKKNISITMREVTVNDSGTYWCGAESTDRRRFFIHKLLVTVVSPTPATSTVSSSAAITAAAWTHSEGADGEVHGVSEAVFSVIICAAVTAASDSSDPHLQTIFMFKNHRKPYRRGLYL